MRRNLPEHIGSALKGLFEEMHRANEAGLTKEAVVSAWVAAAGKKAAKHSSPAQLKGKTLLVNVDSSVWIYQLRLQEKEIVKKMNRLITTKEVEKIKFRSAEI
ncbi:MAG: DUF721 domain-containing protein [Candidatus Omnitrophica bacterium]|nr:DUF721 domain-containing protein [Candidatus Omnitrophota bacterium]